MLTILLLHFGSLDMAMGEIRVIVKVSKKDPVVNVTNVLSELKRSRIQVIQLAIDDKHDDGIQVEIRADDNTSTEEITSLIKRLQDVGVERFAMTEISEPTSVEPTAKCVSKPADCPNEVRQTCRTRRSLIGRIRHRIERLFCGNGRR
jgi:hypothetical protein